MSGGGSNNEVEGFVGSGARTASAAPSDGFAGEFALPIPIFKRFTYWVPSHFSSRAEPGARALLSVGKRKVVGFYLGRAKAAEGGGITRAEIKEVERFLDPSPIFSASMLDFLLRAAAYYHHPEGLALKTAAGPMEMGAETARFAAALEGLSLLKAGRLSGLEEKVVRLCASSPKTWRQLIRSVPILTDDKLGDMIGRGLIEERRSRWGTLEGDDEKICLHVVAAAAALLRRNREGVSFDEGETSQWPGWRKLTPSQKEIIEALCKKGGVTLAALRRSMPVKAADVRRLKREGYITVTVVPPLGHAGSLSESAGAGSGGKLGEGLAACGEEPLRLSEDQKTACAVLDAALARGRFGTFLLFGVTGSGKTEVYLRTIVQALKFGKGAIVIVPEIALTPQLLDVFKRKVGEQVAVLHSGLSPALRARQMRGIIEGRKRVVVGARSALFAPLPTPGVFVVDEEHDASLKQGEGFRYHARDMAILRARSEGAIVILSSATPAVESFYNASTAKYRLLTLPQRVSPNPLPEVEVVNMRKHPSGPHGQNYLTAPLCKALSETLAAGGQAMIFLNRRGYAPVSICNLCGMSIQCPDCSVTLTYHRFTSRLSCHYCGHSEPFSTRCPHCSSSDGMVLRGPGTERIEEVVRGLFPSARVVRMDSDVASGMASEPILRKLREGKADILVGTQMITKGHDLPKMSLVGVVRADSELAFPDFRASERTFSQLTQVAGRAGRGDRPGRVILQTFNPQHPAIEAACKQNYVLFYQWEIRNRRALAYPPFSHLALIRLEGPAEERVMERGRKLALRLKGYSSRARGFFRVLGPAISPISRIRKKSRCQILLKAEDRGTLSSVLEEVAREGVERRSDVRIVIDVDPLDFM